MVKLLPAGKCLSRTLHSASRPMQRPKHTMTLPAMAHREKSDKMNIVQNNY
jgi:hypothetical protein